LLKTIARQQVDGLDCEVFVIDSGSTDRTVEIAHAHACRIIHIAKSEFSFGRCLNTGCAAAKGDYVVFVSGHCIPIDERWLRKLVAPLQSGDVVYTYGRQVGGNGSKFSECQLFRKYFPETSRIPQEGFFCNNANAALLRAVWAKYRFDEELTGLEDMHLAKRLVEEGASLGYVADATVYHYHHEGWKEIKRRYEREAIALQHIMPEIHLTFADFCRYFAGAVLLDVGAGLQERKLWRTFPDIVMFRLMQFWGAYRGNHDHRKLSRERKEQYFYPKERAMCKSTRKITKE
jgi:glycosyltransferase involved in cell wall biosynthesis